MCGSDREKLIELLSLYFDIGDSYAYNLTRVKSAFSVGTMTLDDFEEFDDDTVSDIADHLLAHGVTVQRWIPVSERLPEPKLNVLVYGVAGDGEQIPSVHSGYTRGIDEGWFTWEDSKLISNVTHWLPLPKAPEENDYEWMQGRV